MKKISSLCSSQLVNELGWTELPSPWIPRCQKIIDNINTHLKTPLVHLHIFRRVLFSEPLGQLSTIITKPIHKERQHSCGVQDQMRYPALLVWISKVNYFMTNPSRLLFPWKNVQEIDSSKEFPSNTLLRYGIFAQLFYPYVECNTRT